MQALQEINTLNHEQGLELFSRCCVAKEYALAMVDAMPFASVAALESASDFATTNLTQAGLLEGFSGHPRIGDRKPHSAWSSAEQSGLGTAQAEVLTQLHEANISYEKKFDHVFLICATGKTADFMLAQCSRRIENSPAIEIEEAREELRRINLIRIHKILEGV